MLHEMVHKMWNIIGNVLKKLNETDLDYSSDDDSYMRHLWYNTCLDHKDFRDTDYIMPSH